MPPKRSYSFCAVKDGNTDPPTRSNEYVEILIPDRVPGLGFFVSAIY